VLAGLASLAAATGWDETLTQLRKLSLLEVSILLALSLVVLWRGPILVSWVY